MSAIHPREYNPEKTIEEIVNLIKENEGRIFNYEVKRVVSVAEVPTIEIKIELYQDSEAKKVIV